MPNSCKRLVDLLRQGAGHDQIVRGGAVARHHAIADEAVADAGNHRDLADLLGQLHGGRQHVLRRLGAAHDFEQAHDIGGTEEMQADHILRTLGERRDLIEIQRRGVGGENGALPHHLIELLEYLSS